jgi:hypothetical protein
MDVDDDEDMGEGEGHEGEGHEDEEHQDEDEWGGDKGPEDDEHSYYEGRQFAEGRDDGEDETDGLSGAGPSTAKKGKRTVHTVEVGGDTVVTVVVFRSVDQSIISRTVRALPCARTSLFRYLGPYVAHEPSNRSELVHRLLDTRLYSNDTLTYPIA